MAALNHSYTTTCHCSLHQRLIVCSLKTLIATPYSGVAKGRIGQAHAFMPCLTKYLVGFAQN